MVSSKDVAKGAGVSQPTVSRVLNKPDSVKPETREKVLRTMQTLGYKPNLIARSLITNNTKTIALISGPVCNEFFAESIDSIVRKADEYGYKIIVYFDEEENLDDILKSVSGFNVDGILMSSITLEESQLEKIKALNTPYMFFARRSKLKSNSVTLDDKRASVMLTNHLIDLGHEKIAMITGESDRSTFLERRQGFDKAINAAGVDIPDSYYIKIKDSSRKEVGEAVKKLIQLYEPPTAVLCASDAIAISAIDVLLSMNLRVPEDISICGFDNVGLSSHRAIQLTSIGYDGGHIGEIAVQHLIKQMNRKERALEDQDYKILSPKLFIRKTTKEINSY
ncbi:LacI family DNA-binding transcriptional regulator [Corticicoccus populi]|uniref:LacI family DNA-binding transcriptional regulator n=1 Tax=Corticicoccus populi TaxID=1812821 RepID=A0ABW5X184_9STAP